MSRNVRCTLYPSPCSLHRVIPYIGLPIPEKFKDVLAQLHGREKKEQDEMTKPGDTLNKTTTTKPDGSK